MDKTTDTPLTLSAPFWFLQVAEALDRPEWFLKWGKHYLPSLANAHLLEQAHNFKDPGVQLYGKLKNDARSLLHQVFD